MADDKKSHYTPASSLSVEDVKNLGMFFKELLAENPLVRYSIYAAGIGGALEGLHILWLTVKYIAKF